VTDNDISFDMDMLPRKLFHASLQPIKMRPESDKPGAHRSKGGRIAYQYFQFFYKEKRVAKRRVIETLKKKKRIVGMRRIQDQFKNFWEDSASMIADTCSSIHRQILLDSLHLFGCLASLIIFMSIPVVMLSVFSY
jgi:hypothetical protein